MTHTVSLKMMDRLLISLIHNNDFNLLFTLFVAVPQSYLKILYDTAVAAAVFNATHIDFFYLHVCHDIIKHFFNENITELDYYKNLIFFTLRIDVTKSGIGNENLFFQGDYR